MSEAPNPARAARRSDCGSLPKARGPMNIGVSVVGNSTSMWQIDYTLDDLSGNPTLGASNPTIFSSMSGSSTATYGSFSTPIAAIRLTMNALSSAGGKVTATILQAGISEQDLQNRE
jgi:hypothetical protein